jgi:hypothetical protein
VAGLAVETAWSTARRGEVDEVAREAGVTVAAEASCGTDLHLTVDHPHHIPILSVIEIDLTSPELKRIDYPLAAVADILRMQKGQTARHFLQVASLPYKLISV